MKRLTESENNEQIYTVIDVLNIYPIYITTTLSLCYTNCAE